MKGLRPLPSRASRPLVVGIGALLLGLVVSVFATLDLEQSNEQAVRDLFDRRSHALNEAVLKRVTLYQYGLRGARGALLAVGIDAMTRERFREYSASRDLRTEFPGTRGFGIVRRVPRAELDAFLAMASRDRGEPFELHELAPNEGERWIIQYVEPEADNRPAIGLDIASETARRSAGFNAARTGQPALSAPIRLVQVQSTGFLLLMPIYAPGMPTANPDQRMQALRGWAYTPLVASEVLAGLDQEVPNVEFAILDTTAPDSPQPVVDSGAARAASGLEHRAELDLFGRRWQLTTRPRPALMAELHETDPRLALGIGAGISLLVAVLAALLTLMFERSRRTRQEQLELARGIFNASPNAVIVVDDSGRIVETNRRVEAVLGYPTSQLVGRGVDLLLPEAQRRRHAEQRASYDGSVRSMSARQDLRARAADGREFPVEVHLSPLQLQGRRLVVATLDDVSEIRAAVQRIRDSEARWRELANSMPQLTWTCTGDGQCDFLSQQWVSYTGIDEASQLGFGWIEQVHPDDRDHLTERWNAAVATRSTFIVEFRIRRRDGVYRWFDTRAEPMLETDGTVRAWIGSNTDIEDRKQAEEGLRALNTSLEQQVQARTEALRQTSALQKVILDSAGYAIIATDTEGLITLFNPAAEAMLGYSASEMVGRQTTAIIHDGEEDLSQAQALTKELGFEVPVGFDAFVAKARLGTPDENEWTYVRKDGSRFPVRLKVSALRDETGQLTGFLGIAIDLTETHRREAALNQARQEAVQIGRDLRTILDAMPSMVAYWDWNLRNRFANHAYRDWFGVEPEQLPGTHLRDLLGPDIFEANRPYIEGALAGKPQEFERPIKGRASLARYVPDIANGEVRGFYAFVTDVSALRTAMEAAEAASSAKSAFLANMSHEIRTPMNAVMNLCYLIEQTPLNEEQRDLASKMRIASRSLLGLINDVLDLSKIEAGSMALARQPFSLHRLVRDLDHLMRSQAAVKRLLFKITIAPNVPDTVRGDGLRINQVLTNLLSNAIKFTDRGEVELKLEVQSADDPSARIHFEVSDTGIGIGREALDRLFQPFTQADDSTTRRFGGSGLGLAIVRRLVDLMGGELGVDSEPGRGSRFWFAVTLPVEQQGSLPELAPQTVNALVVEPTSLDRPPLSTLCRALGWRTESVDREAEALQRVADRVQSEHPFDAVIIDEQVPGLDSPRALGQLHQQLGNRTRPAIVLVASTDALAAHHESVRPLVDEVLTTPVDASALFNAVHRVMAQHSAAASHLIDGRRLSTALKRLVGARILLVDDSSINLDVGRRLLEREGALVRIATQGKQAVDLVTHDDAAFDVVLMDVQMPVMDGLEATRQIRRLPGAADLPIVALTAGALIAERERALDAGMDDFISKPFDAESMVLRLRELVERHLRHPLPLEAKPQTQADASGQPEVGGLDLSEALSRVGGDQKLMRSLLRRLFDEFHEFGPATVVRRDEQERHDIAQRAHKLRGIAGNVGAHSLREAAAELEACARNPACSETSFHLARIEQLIATLQIASLQFLSETAPPSRSADAPVLTAAQIDRLRQELRENRLSALDVAEKLEPGLRQLLGTEAYNRLVTALQELRYADALQLLA